MALYQALGVSRLQQGKRFASGTLTPEDADVDVVTGLAVVDHCGVSLAGVPTYNGHMWSQAAPASTAGSIRIRSYEATATDNVTPTASTSEVAVTWWAIGD
jgi:hypothetical protein